MFNKLTDKRYEVLVEDEEFAKLVHVSDKRRLINKALSFAKKNGVFIKAKMVDMPYTELSDYVKRLYRFTKKTARIAARYGCCAYPMAIDLDEEPLINNEYRADASVEYNPVTVNRDFVQMDNIESIEYLRETAVKNDIDAERDIADTKKDVVLFKRGDSCEYAKEQINYRHANQPNAVVYKLHYFDANGDVGKVVKFTTNYDNCNDVVKFIDANHGFSDDHGIQAIHFIMRDSLPQTNDPDSLKFFDMNMFSEWNDVVAKSSKDNCANTVKYVMDKHRENLDKHNGCAGVASVSFVDFPHSKKKDDFGAGDNCIEAMTYLWNRHLYVKNDDGVCDVIFRPDNDSITANDTIIDVQAYLEELKRNGRYNTTEAARSIPFIAPFAHSKSGMYSFDRDAFGFDFTDNEDAYYDTHSNMIVSRRIFQDLGKPLKELPRSWNR